MRHLDCSQPGFLQSILQKPLLLENMSMTQNLHLAQLLILMLFLSPYKVLPTSFLDCICWPWLWSLLRLLGRH
jgi:hypothetical protein